MVASSALGSDLEAAQNVDLGTARPEHSEERRKIGKVTHTFACRSVNSKSILGHDTFFERGIMGLSSATLTATTG